MYEAILIQPRSSVLDLNKGKPSPPFGLLCLARSLSPECRVRILDQRIPGFDRELRRILETKPLFIGITAIAGPMIRHAVEISEKVKSASPDARVVWGGPHSIVAGDLAARHPCVDAVVIADGEITALKIARAMKNDESLAPIRGLWLKNGEGDVTCTGEPEFPDLDALPPVSYEIVGDRYFYPSLGKPTAYFETSRGCPYKCSYCYQSSRSFPRRFMSPEKAIESCLFLVRENPSVGHLYIVDDNYFFEKDRALEISRLLIAKSMSISYQVQGATQIDLERFSDEELALLRRSGCVRVDIGAESGSARMSKALGKKVDSRRLLEMIGRLTKVDIIPWINFMSGFPDESEEDLNKTVDTVRAITQNFPKTLVSPIYAYYPYPETRMYDQAIEKGFIKPETVGEIARGAWRTPQSPWLSQGRRTALDRLYFYSIFIDAKVAFYSSSRRTAFMMKFLKPLARFRLKRRCFGFPFEKWFFEKFFGKEY